MKNNNLSGFFKEINEERKLTYSKYSEIIYH